MGIYSDIEKEVKDSYSEPREVCKNCCNSDKSDDFLICKLIMSVNFNKVCPYGSCAKFEEKE